MFTKGLKKTTGAVFELVRMGFRQYSAAPSEFAGSLKHIRQIQRNLEQHAGIGLLTKQVSREIYDSPSLKRRAKEFLGHTTIQTKSTGATHARYTFANPIPNIPQTFQEDFANTFAATNGDSGLRVLPDQVSQSTTLVHRTRTATVPVIMEQGALKQSQSLYGSECAWVHQQNPLKCDVVLDVFSAFDIQIVADTDALKQRIDSLPTDIHDSFGHAASSFIFLDPKTDSTEQRPIFGACSKYVILKTINPEGKLTEDPVPVNIYAFTYQNTFYVTREGLRKAFDLIKSVNSQPLINGLYQELLAKINDPSYVEQNPLISEHIQRIKAEYQALGWENVLEEETTYEAKLAALLHFNLYGTYNNTETLEEVHKEGYRITALIQKLKPLIAQHPHVEEQKPTTGPTT